MADTRSLLERLLSRKVELWLVGLIVMLLLGAMLIFGSIVQRQASGEHDFGRAGDMAMFVATMPQEFKRSLRLVLQGDHTDLMVHREFDARSGFVFNYEPDTDPEAGFLLLSRYDGDTRRSTVELVDLNRQTIVHQWTPDFAEIFSRASLVSNLTDLERDNAPARARIFHPLATEDGGLVFANMSPLIKIDACSNLEWITDGLYHHTIEPDLSDGFWVPAFLEPQTLENVTKKFKEDALTKISSDGEILFQKSLPQILIDNGLERLVFGLDFYSDDPTHLNDIEPVRFDGPYWRRGDLFLSLRSTASIILYRPGENRIVWLKQGPWANQHDVDIVDEHSIAVFNNNRMNRHNRHYVAGHNDVVIYDFSTDTVSSPVADAMESLDIRSVSEGRSQVIANGNVLIEESNSGRTLMLNSSGEIVWNHINRAADGNIYLVNWSRYVSSKQGSELMQSIRGSGCG